MSTTQGYFAGTDVEVYLSLDNETSYTNLPKLDIRSITIIEDGTVIPLYDYCNYIVKHFAYTTRLVNGALQFNFSKDYVDKFTNSTTRTPFGTQPMQNATLWVVMSNVEYWPELKIVRDVVRMDYVWEHASQLNIEPYVGVTVPYTARSINVVTRQSRRFADGALTDFIADPDRFIVDGNNVFAGEEETYQGKILHVIDGDTYVIERLDNSKVETIRLAGADTPEDPWKIYTSSDKRTVTRRKPELAGGLDKASIDARWVAVNTGFWPAEGRPNAGAPDAERDLKHEERQSPRAWAAQRGGSTTTPTADQLDRWGFKIGHIVKEKIEGKTVTVIIPPGQSPALTYDRVAAEIRHGSDELSAWLIARGYASWYSRGATVSLTGGQYAERSQLLQRLHREAAAKAGTSEAQGIWASLEP